MTVICLSEAGVLSDPVTESLVGSFREERSDGAGGKKRDQTETEQKGKRALLRFIPLAACFIFLIYEYTWWSLNVRKLLVCKMTCLTAATCNKTL